MDDGLRSAFVRGCLFAACLMVATAGLIAAFGTGADRPEGVAERWLTAVGDTTRDGVSADARERAEEIGPVALAEPRLLPKGDTDGDAAFGDLEVGDAAVSGARARVPFQLHQFAASGEGPLRTGTLVLERVDVDGDEEWHVAAVERRGRGEIVPSEGGDPPSRAPLGAWVGGVVLAALLCALGSRVVRSASGGPAATLTLRA